MFVSLIDTALWLVRMVLSFEISNFSNRNLRLVHHFLVAVGLDRVKTTRSALIS